MEWIAEIGQSWLSTLAWLAGLAVAFGILARLMPCNPGMHWWKDPRGVATDFIYWFIVPLFLRVCRTLMLVAGVALLFGGDPWFASVKELPLWQQCLAILLIQDVMMYWIHRAFHSRLAWKFHAIHHSPKVLDWMSASRFHPINNLLEFALADVAVLLMGFAPAALVILTPLNLIYSAMVHANLNWTFGPLRYFFASPVFHRWHHTTLEEGINKNFAPTFPFLDVIFGTFHMPPGKLPEQFGTGEPDFPQGFWGQFFHPFRTTSRLAAARMAMTALAIVGLLGGGIYLTTRLAARNEQRARIGERTTLPPLRAEIPGQASQPDRAPRDWVENDTRTVTSVAISADGRCIVSGSKDGTVKVWDAVLGREKFTLSGHRGAVSSVAMNADGQRIVSAGHDKTVKVWDAATGQEKLTLTGHKAAVLSVAISADSQHIVSGSADGTAKVWDAATGQEELTLSKRAGAVPGVAISADGRRIVSASWEMATIWDGRTGQEERTLKGHTDLVYCVAISPDGKRIFSGSLDKSVKVWDAETGREELALAGHTGPVYSVAISPDGNCLVSGSDDKTGRVWDAAMGGQLRSLLGHAGAVTSVAVSAEGRIVSVSRDGTMKVWDAPVKQTARQPRASAPHAP